MVNTILDLEACYNQYLPNIYFLVQEYIGVQLNQSIIMSKLFWISEYHLRTSYGITDSYYGGNEDSLVNRSG